MATEFTTCCSRKELVFCAIGNPSASEFPAPPCSHSATGSVQKATSLSLLLAGFGAISIWRGAVSERTQEIRSKKQQPISWLHTGCVLSDLKDHLSPFWSLRIHSLSAAMSRGNNLQVVRRHHHQKRTAEGEQQSFRCSCSITTKEWDFKSIGSIRTPGLAGWFFYCSSSRSSQKFSNPADKWSLAFKDMSNFKRVFMKGFQATVLANLGNHIVNLEVSQRVENYTASLCLHSFKTETLDKWNESVMRINTLSYDKIPGIYPDSPNNNRQDILKEWVSLFTVWNNIWMAFLACMLLHDFPSSVPLAFRKPEGQISI